MANIRELLREVPTPVSKQKTMTIEFSTLFAFLALVLHDGSLSNTSKTTRMSSLVRFNVQQHPLPLPPQPRSIKSAV